MTIIKFLVIGMNKSVLVAMSGGVDSSVAAGLLQQQGFRVVGVFMCLGVADQTTGHQGCCSPQDARAAKEVANQRGIQFHVMDFQDEIEEVNMDIDMSVEEHEDTRRRRDYGGGRGGGGYGGGGRGGGGGYGGGRGGGRSGGYGGRDRRRN